MALRFILLIPSGQPAGGLGCFQATGGGKSTGKKASAPGGREPLPSWPTAPASLGLLGNPLAPWPPGQGVSQRVARLWPQVENQAVPPNM